MTDLGDDVPRPPPNAPIRPALNPPCGRTLWAFETSESISDLDVAGDLVCVGAGSTVSALDPASGTVCWQFHATLDGSHPLFDGVLLSAATGG